MANFTYEHEYPDESEEASEFEDILQPAWCDLGVHNDEQYVDQDDYCIHHVPIILEENKSIADNMQQNVKAEEEQNHNFEKY